MTDAKTPLVPFSDLVPPKSKLDNKIIDTTDLIGRYHYIHVEKSKDKAIKQIADEVELLYTHIFGIFPLSGPGLKQKIGDIIQEVDTKRIKRRLCHELDYGSDINSIRVRDFARKDWVRTDNHNLNLSNSILAKKKFVKLEGT